LFKTPEVKSALRSAESGTQNLLRIVPVESVETRFALLNFLNGVRYVRSDATKFLRVEDALAYVRKLDQSVSAAMVREKVASESVNAWKQISVAALFNLGQPSETIEKPFNPQLNLLRVRVRQPPDRFRRWIEDGPAFVDFKAAVVGRDVKKINVYYNGTFVASRVPLAPDENGLRMFGMGNRPARGIYTFRVYDKYGAVYEKHYLFYPIARRFAWQRDAQGAFAIPVSSGKDVDPRLERLFAFRRGTIISSQSPYESITTASDQSFSKF
jgi:hypothetical protein